MDCLSVQSACLLYAQSLQNEVKVNQSLNQLHSDPLYDLDCGTAVYVDTIAPQVVKTLAKLRHKHLVHDRFQGWDWWSGAVIISYDLCLFTSGKSLSALLSSAWQLEEAQLDGKCVYS